jgi:hypothetical protein
LHVLRFCILKLYLVAASHVSHGDAGAKKTKVALRSEIYTQTNLGF